MGFLDDNWGAIIGGAVAPGIGAIPGSIFDQERVANRPPGPTRIGHGWTGEQSGPEAQGTDDISKLVVGTFGPTGADYSGVFGTAYDRLGQSNAPINPLQVGGSVLQLATEYAKEYQKQSGGQLPSQDQLRQFVSAKLDVPTAQGFIQGNYTPGQVTQDAQKYVMNDPSLAQQRQAQEAAAAKSSQDATLNEQNRLLSDYIKGQTEQGTQDLNAQFDQQRGRLIDEMGSNVTQPNARISLDALDNQRSKSVSDLIRGIRTGGAQAGFGAASQASQFGQSLALQNKQLDQNQSNLSDQIKMLRDNQSYDRGQDIIGQGLAAQLGKQKADASKPGLLDYLNTGANIARGIGSIGSGFA